MTTPLPVTTLDPVLEDTDDEGVIHWFCLCSPDLAYCGWDVSGHVDMSELASPDDLLCVVCDDYPMCPRCWQ